LFHTIVAALEDNGHQVAATDLYREQFDPAMSADERRSYYAARYDNTMVSAHAALLIISRVDGIILCFPHWWFAMPAMLKGYFDRVWAPGIAFERDIAGGRIRPLLAQYDLDRSTSAARAAFIARVRAQVARISAGERLCDDPPARRGQPSMRSSGS
jgi:NAD(P)H dehydrogenase (quinone)